jgi:hypothetical protein
VLLRMSCEDLNTPPTSPLSPATSSSASPIGCLMISPEEEEALLAPSPDDLDCLPEDLDVDDLLCDFPAQCGSPSAGLLTEEELNKALADLCLLPEQRDLDNPCRLGREEEQAFKEAYDRQLSKSPSNELSPYPDSPDSSKTVVMRSEKEDASNAATTCRKEMKKTTASSTQSETPATTSTQPVSLKQSDSSIDQATVDFLGQARTRIRIHPDLPHGNHLDVEYEALPLHRAGYRRRQRTGRVSSPYSRLEAECQACHGPLDRCLNDDCRNDHHDLHYHRHQSPALSKTLPPNDALNRACESSTSPEPSPQPIKKKRRKRRSRKHDNSKTQDGRDWEVLKGEEKSSLKLRLRKVGGGRVDKHSSGNRSPVLSTPAKLQQVLPRVSSDQVQPVPALSRNQVTLRVKRDKTLVTRSAARSARRSGEIEEQQWPTVCFRGSALLKNFDRLPIARPWFRNVSNDGLRAKVAGTGVCVPLGENVVSSYGKKMMAPDQVDQEDPQIHRIRVIYEFRGDKVHPKHETLSKQTYDLRKPTVLSQLVRNLRPGSRQVHDELLAMVCRAWTNIYQAMDENPVAGEELSIPHPPGAVHEVLLLSACEDARYSQWEDISGCPAMIAVERERDFNAIRLKIRTPRDQTACIHWSLPDLRAVRTLFLKALSAPSQEARSLSDADYEAFRYSVRQDVYVMPYGQEYLRGLDNLPLDFQGELPCVLHGAQLMSKAYEKPAGTYCTYKDALQEKKATIKRYTEREYDAIISTQQHVAREMNKVGLAFQLLIYRRDEQEYPALPLPLKRPAPGEAGDPSPSAPTGSKRRLSVVPAPRPRTPPRLPDVTPSTERETRVSRTYIGAEDNHAPRPRHILQRQHAVMRATHVPDEVWHAIRREGEVGEADVLDIDTPSDLFDEDEVDAGADENKENRPPSHRLSE